MLSMEFKKNFDKLTTPDRNAEYATALLVPVTYIGIPTIFGLKNWKAWCVGVGVTVGLGLTLNLPGMISGGIAAGVTHLGYSYFSDEVANLFKNSKEPRGPWNFSPRDGAQQGMTAQPLNGYYHPQEYMAGLAAGPEVVTLPDGSQVYAYNPRELPAEGMSGYYNPSEQLNDGADMVDMTEHDPFMGMYNEFDMGMN